MATNALGLARPPLRTRLRSHYLIRSRSCAELFIELLLHTEARVPNRGTISRVARAANAGEDSALNLFAV